MIVPLMWLNDEEEVTEIETVVELEPMVLGEMGFERIPLIVLDEEADVVLIESEDGVAEVPNGKL